MVPEPAGTGLICAGKRFNFQGYGDIGAPLVFGQTFSFTAVPEPIGFTFIPQGKLIHS